MLQRLISSLAGAGLLLAGCSHSPPSQHGVRIALTSTMDVAPFYLANDMGYFAAAGIDIPNGRIIIAKSDGESVSLLTGGQVDIAFSSYPPFFVAQSNAGADLKLIADGSSAAPNTSVLLADKNSPVKRIGDLAGKRIAITGRNTMAQLLTASRLHDFGVDPKGIQWVEMGPDQMGPALQRGEVDAAYMTEPYLSQAEKVLGSVQLLDTAAGPTADMPVTGYGTTKKYWEANQDLVTQFQLAMRRASQEATANPSILRQLLQRHLRIDDETMNLSSLHLPTYQFSLGPARIERALALLKNWGDTPLKQNVDVAAMIVRVRVVDA